MASVSSAGLHLSQIDFNLHSVSGIKILSANELLMHACGQVSIVFSAGQVDKFQ
jgi:hypothetical protein